MVLSQESSYLLRRNLILKTLTKAVVKGRYSALYSGVRFRPPISGFVLAVYALGRHLLGVEGERQLHFFTTQVCICIYAV